MSRGKCGRSQRLGWFHRFGTAPHSFRSGICDNHVGAVLRPWKRHTSAGFRAGFPTLPATVDSMCGSPAGIQNAGPDSAESPDNLLQQQAA